MNYDTLRVRLGKGRRSTLDCHLLGWAGFGFGLCCDHGKWGSAVWEAGSSLVCEGWDPRVGLSEG